MFAGIVVGGNYLTSWVLEGLNVEITPVNEPAVHRLIVMSSITYVLLMSIPFVPGAEIGFGLMMILGPKIAPLVYLCTLLSLLLSFIVGRFIPDQILINFFHEVRLRRVSTLLSELQGLDYQQRFELLIERSPKKWIPFLLKHRYVALMLVINLPGNIMIGGGGGIALVSGMSRLFSPGKFLLTIAIAVSPIPLFLVMFGGNIADWPV